MITFTQVIITFIKFTSHINTALSYHKVFMKKYKHEVIKTKIYTLKVFHNRGRQLSNVNFLFNKNDIKVFFFYKNVLFTFSTT